MWIAEGSAQSIDKVSMLQRMTFLDNQDYEWYQKNIPFFDCPDEELLKTYYYRWELITKHLTYGSPETGYVFTEFIDRPFWSGAYGAISCPAGHQLYEARWLLDPQVANDYTRYWLETPGAQPRNYSTWLADSAVAVYDVHPDDSLLRKLLPGLVKNYEEWEKRHFVPSVGLFWQTGHDDGMEFNINSRQTKDILRGAPSYRPSFNAYMWADAVAISRIASKFGEEEIASRFEEKAKSLQKNLLEKLWDPKRQFFFPMLRDNEERDGFAIKAETLTYQTGQHAGSPHGRELIGYVPWQFSMVPNDRDYAVAWKLLMEEEGFLAPFGPTTVERNDPMFLLQNSCCWWSGQSWPYATTQTLKALANVVQSNAPYGRTSEDYMRLLKTYSQSHRKNGKPYLAEAIHPDLGLFDGHDGYNHSEHYFHSGFCDLIITGLVGLRPDSATLGANSSSVRIHPLATDEWDYFALEDVPCRGHRLAVLWDKTGSRYGKGAGFSVWSDGKLIKRSDRLAPMELDLPIATSTSPNARIVNYAVNNDGSYYPSLTATFTAPNTSAGKLNDGNYWYLQHPPNRWTSQGSDSPNERIEIAFGKDRPVQWVQLYFLDDRQLPDAPPESKKAIIQSPESFQVFALVGDDWRSIYDSKQQGAPVQGHRPTRVDVSKAGIASIKALRIDLVPQPGAALGLTEIEAWGPVGERYEAAGPPAGNLAYRAPGAEYPVASASFSDRFGGQSNNAIDGKTVFMPTPMNRWTSYESKNERDWLQIDFGTVTEFRRVDLAIYDDRGGVQAPKAYTIEYWSNNTWVPVTAQVNSPTRPLGSSWNQSTFEPVKSSKLRIQFENASPARSGVTEVMVWNSTAIGSTSTEQ